MNKAKECKVNQVKISDGFWSKRQELVTDVVIPYQEKILNNQVPDAEKSNAIANFKIAAGMEQGEFYGMVFQDSDLAKWLEAAAYSLVLKPDQELEQRADEIIGIIEAAQQEDGYLNTYFTIKEPEHRWQNLLECHELYCAGHMMEAAAAYYEATGKDRLLKVMERMADHIIDRIGPDKEKGVPGHQEIEIGLLCLYRVTGKEKYLREAEYFINERGQNPDYFKEEAKKRDWNHFGMDPADTYYNQSFAPVREQKTAEGHAVRAVYMYTAMAELAAKTGDESLIKACETLWENITRKRMYITGGVGSTSHGEAFSADYDLPNDTVYAETCASVAMVFFAHKMLEISPSSKYSDIMEKELYNGIISSMQLDGQRFFYVNPLEVDPSVSGKVSIYRHVRPERPRWYACACCPPNVARLLTSLGKYIWHEKEDCIYSHLFIGSKLEAGAADITLEAKLPWEGKAVYTVDPKSASKFTLAIRVPAYAKNTVFTVNGKEMNDHELRKDGYVYIERNWEKGDQIQVSFDMPVTRMYANTEVRANAGAVALMRGPIVYCLEGVDNGERLQELRIPREAVIEAGEYEENLLSGIIPLTLEGIRVKTNTQELYTEEAPVRETVKIKAIPYYAWGNRGLNQMRVWVLEA
ncbi:hypothetical protein HNQ56_003366 [Anaerotaenia torta]|uniref:glycoside hydrolase family 127 protein n=1 Tax=Anaerotaenia torta TaxID=433293 RepID=UPI003D1FF609